MKISDVNLSVQNCKIMPCRKELHLNHVFYSKYFYNNESLILNISYIYIYIVVLKLVCIQENKEYKTYIFFFFLDLGAVQ